MTSYYELGAANDRIAELRPLLAALREDRDAIASAQVRLRRLAASDEPDRAELEREREAVTCAAQCTGDGHPDRRAGAGQHEEPGHE